MNELERLEKKVADTKAAADSAYNAYDDVDLADYIDHAAAYDAYAAALAAYRDTGAAYIKAVGELKEYKEQVKTMNNADMPGMVQPVTINDYDAVTTTFDKNSTDYMGLTKREHFAGLAMQGLLAVGYCKDVPSAAINFADDLLKALEQKVLDTEADEAAYMRELKLVNGAVSKWCSSETL
jgi:hypothetical protein